MTHDARTQGALAGMRVLEFTAKGPVPLCTMFLADMGADVIQIARPSGSRRTLDPSLRFTDRGKQEIVVDLKAAEGIDLVRRLMAGADVLVEGFRPGTMERLGLGPQDCEALNPRLVYTRITGWGQTGPRSRQAGHDINFMAVTGALDAIGTAESGPVPPLNLLADFAGGSLHAAFGICAALVERGRSGRGQVIDVAMTDGVLSLMTALFAIHARGDWTEGRGGNFLDGGAPYYAVYRTRDDRYLAVGAMERPFREQLFSVLGLPSELVDTSEQPMQWQAVKAMIASVVETRTQAEWVDAFDGRDACVTAVATLEEALRLPELAARQAFVPGSAGAQPAASPRLSRTPSAKAGIVQTGREAAKAVLRSQGYGEHEIAAMLDRHVVG